MLPSIYSYVGFFTINILRKIKTKPECYNEIVDKILCFQGPIFSLDPEMTKNQVQDLVKIPQSGILEQSDFFRDVIKGLP